MRAEILESILVLPFHACFHTEIVDLVEQFWSS